MRGLAYHLFMIVVPAALAFVAFQFSGTKGLQSKSSNADISGIQAKLEQLDESLRKISQNGSKFSGVSQNDSDAILSSIQAMHKDIVASIKEIGGSISSLEGRLDALHLNKNYTKVFYPVGQEKLFFEHFPKNRYQVVSKNEAKDGSVIGYQYEVRRKLDLENYNNPYKKDYLEVAH